MKVLYIVVILFLPTVVNALDFYEKEDFISIGFGFGGDTLAETSADKLTAGGGVSIDYGKTIVGSNYYQYQFSMGVKAENLNASNGSASFIRFPVEVIVLKMKRGFRFGGGLSYHLNPAYKMPTFEEDFDNALGLIGQFDIITKKSSMISLRYEWLNYKPNNLYNINTGQKVDNFNADNFSLLVRFHF